MTNPHGRIPWITAMAVMGLIMPTTICAGSEPTSSISLSLAQALLMVKHTNLTVIQAQEDEAISEARARSVKATLRPSISGTTYGTFGDSNNIVTSSPAVMPQNIFNVPSRGFADQDVMAVTPLYAGDRLAGQLANARLQSIAAKYGVEAAQLTAQSDVTQAYAKVLLELSLTDAAHGKTVAEDEQVRQTAEKVKLGAAAPVDLLREQAELADAQQSELAASNDAQTAMVDLKTILGMDLSTDMILKDTLGSLSGNRVPPPTPLAVIIDQALRERPDSHAADAKVRAATADVRAARGAYEPQVYGVGMADSAVMDGGGHTVYTVGITASVNLYDSGERRADMDAARAQAERAQTNALELRQMIAREVSDASLSYQTALAEVSASVSGVTAASEAYRLADLRYNAGKSVAAERLDSLAALTRAQGNLAQAEYGVISTRAVLTAAMGEDAIR